MTTESPTALSFPNASSSSPAADPPSDSVLALAYVFVSVELALHPAVLCISALNFWVLSSSRILHPNLRFILICQSLAIVGFELERIGLIWQKFLSGNMFNPGLVAFQITARIATLFRNCIPHVIIVERLAATLFVQHYEKWRKPYFNICWCSMLVILSLTNGLSTLASWSTSFFTLLIQSFLMLLILLEIFCFGLIRFFNFKKYETIVAAKATAKNYSLSEKFQLSENIRTSQQLAPSFLCHFLNNAIGVAVFYIGYNQLIQSAYLNSLFFALTNTLTSLIDLGVEITVISHHPVLKKKFLALIKRLMFWRNVRVHIERTEDHDIPLEAQQQPRDIRGGPLINQLDMDLHFRMLEAEWR